MKKCNNKYLLLIWIIIELLGLVLAFFLLSKTRKIVSLLFIIFFTLWNIIVIKQIKKSNQLKSSGVSYNGLFGARFLFIWINILLLVYTLNLFKYPVVCIAIFICCCIVVIFKRQWIKQFFVKNKFNLCVLGQGYLVVLLVVSAYSTLVIFFPQLHLAQGLGNTLFTKSIFVSICITTDLLTLPQNSVIARFSTKNYKVDMITCDDVEGNKEIT